MDRSFDELVDLGVFVPGEDESGDIVYQINLKSAFLFAPDIYMAEVNSSELGILSAIDHGYIELDFSIDKDGKLKTGYIVV